MTKVAADYRVSATALVKACRKAGIPVPPQGYWNKLPAGKHVPQRPVLPPPLPGQSETIAVQPSAPPPEVDPRVTLARTAEELPSNRIVVPEELMRPHNIVLEVASILARADVDHRGMQSTGTHSALPNVRVSPAERPRALRILDTFLKAMEARGYLVAADSVTIEGEQLKVSLEEKEDRKLHVPTKAELADSREWYGRKPPNWDYFPSGKLSLSTLAYTWWRNDLRKRWTDGRTIRLEDMLNDAVVGFVSTAIALRQRTEQAEREKARLAEEARLLQEAARQRRLEAARCDVLIESSEAWQSATRLRAFLVEIDRRLEGGIEQRTEAIDQWLAWASEVLEKTDPLGRGIENFIREHEEKAAQTAEDDD